MNRLIAKRVVVGFAICLVYVAFAYVYICGGMIINYDISVSGMDPLDRQQVYYIYNLIKIPFIAFNVFLIMWYLANKCIRVPSNET